MAMMAICSYAASGIWKADANTATAAGSTYLNEPEATVTTVYGTTVGSSSQTIGGESFTHYVQVRVDANPSVGNETGTEYQTTDQNKKSTPLVYTAKVDQTLTVYYRRQSTAQNNNVGVFASGDNKDLFVYDQAAPTTALSGTMTIESQTSDGKYGFGYKVFQLKKDHTYTLCAKGTTIQFYGFKYEPAPTEYTIAWSNPAEYTMPLGNTYDNTAIVTGVDGLTIAFKSSDENVAYIEPDGNKAHIVGTGVGSCVITVYSTNHGELGVDYKEATFTLNVTAGSVNMYFQPTEGYVNVGCSVTPYINFGGALLEKVTSITAVSSDPSIATVPNDILGTNNYATTDEGGKLKVANIYVPITGVRQGTTTITVTFSSSEYTSATATFTIHVTPAGTRNFNWADNRDIYVFKGDMVALPGIVGNSNGNNDYSVGANHKYYYSIKRNNGGFNPTYNNRDWHKGEGYPNYEVVTSASENDRPAYIYWCAGQGGRQQYDTLMIAAQKVGDFTLKATDPQNSNLYITKTIHVLDKADLQDAYNSQVQNMNMPYTWDFTEGLNFTGLNPNYWTVNETGTKATLHYGTAMNADYNDENQNGNVNENIYKHFVGANNSAMINLAGLQLNLGQGATWPNKKDRIDLSPGDGLSVTGDTHKLYIPAPKPHQYTYMGNNSVSKTKVRFYIKGSAMDNKKGGKVDINAYDSNGNRAALTRVDVVGETGQGEDNNFNRSSDYLCYAEIPFDGNQIDHLELWLGNCHIEWMGYSTESKNISSINYATYSYPEDLDFQKTVETQQGVTTYAVSKVNSTSVTLTPLAKAKAGQGFVINGDENEYYFIANARNTYPYSLANDAQDESGNSVTNLLVGTYGDGEAKTIAVTGGSDVEFNEESTGIFHYVLSNSGKHWKNGNTMTGVGFYMANSRATTPFQSAYLPIDAETIRGSIGYFPLFETGETDGIEEIKTEKATNGEYYNLNGTRVSTLTKGIYIHNGKKVVVK